MSVLENAFETARVRKARVVFPELDDPRVAAASERMKSEGLCEPISLAEVSGKHVAVLSALRGTKEALARRLLNKPLFRAAAMVAAGDADVMVAGADSPTRRVIEAASICIGLAEGVSLPSSFFLMMMPDSRALIFSDCAVVVEPSADDLTAIATASAESAKALLGRADVALLSYSTGTSGAGESVDRVRAAAEATGFTGPIQADAALNAVIAKKKGLGSGSANVMVFPSLNAGNIAYKLVQELAGAQALGPFLQGFRRPVCDLSRGATVEDIVASTVIACSMG